MGCFSNTKGGNQLSSPFGKLYWEVGSLRLEMEKERMTSFIRSIAAISPKLSYLISSSLLSTSQSFVVSEF